MERKRCYAYNKTREAFLSLDVTLNDRFERSLLGAISERELKTNEGLWFASSLLSQGAGCGGSCDRIFLDSALRVIALDEAVPGYPIHSAPDAFESVLVLPVQTVFASQTQLGDQLFIGAREEIGAMLNDIQPSADGSTAYGINQKRRTRQAFMKWLSRLFSSRERRRSERHASLPLMAFYWDGGIPVPHAVPDISRSGLFVKTADRWFPRTLLRVTLQKQSADPEHTDETITVQCRVVRTGEDGVGMAFMLAEDMREDQPSDVGTLATRRDLNQFFEHLVSDVNGASTFEHPYLPFPEMEHLNGQGQSAQAAEEKSNEQPEAGLDGHKN